MHALAKVTGFVLEPLNTIWLLLVLGALLAAVGRRRLAATAVVAGGLAFLLIATTPLAEALLRALEDRFPRRPVDPAALAGAIVLGGGTGDAVVAAERGTYLLNEAAERLTTAAALRRRYPDLPIVVSGFSAAVSHRGASEGEITRRLMADFGFAADAFLYEERSRTTHENARFTARLVGTDGTWLLVTSAFHMPRAVAAFRAAGFAVVPYPVDYRAPAVSWSRLVPAATARFEWMRVALKEWVGLAAYRVLGRTETLFPGPSP